MVVFPKPQNCSQEDSTDNEEAVDESKNCPHGQTIRMSVRSIHDERLRARAVMEGETVHDLQFHLARQPGLSGLDLANRLRKEGAYIFLL